eukprot:6682966-Alexandrium_andersonii.AAC.1
MLCDHAARNLKLETLVKNSPGLEAIPIARGKYLPVELNFLKGNLQVPEKLSVCSDDEFAVRSACCGVSAA